MRFVFKRSFPPTLSASNPNVVSGVKCCRSSNGQQTALFTELTKIYACINLLYLFSASEYILYLQKLKNWQVLLVPLSLPLIFTQQIIY